MRPTDDVAHANDERIVSHVERHFGPGGMVFHEIVSDRVHVDVHLFPANEKFEFQLLLTSGMSALPMTVPRAMPNAESFKFAELCVLLSPDWPLTQAAMKDERIYWPIRLMKQLARFPHEYATWLGRGHSIPNGNPGRPYANGTKLAGALLIPPLALGKDMFAVPGDLPIHILQLLPVTASEMQMKLDIGTDALMEKLLDQAPEVFGAIDPTRDSIS